MTSYKLPHQKCQAKTATPPLDGSRPRVVLISQRIDELPAARLGSRSEPFSRGMSFCLYASRSGANKKSPNTVTYGRLHEEVDELSLNSGSLRLDEHPGITQA
ncbi:hypothetical protein EYF80_054799 [Liparis tanakae]|uniref:Uncharacterized protein n=1 Tax=Liparis tanakae TaxID=230148 RepID=A0A4Z2F3G4_9TELE|nr:hypothetical protein EYF80_054799 [Liparis tanakae]